MITLPDLEISHLQVQRHEDIKRNYMYVLHICGRKEDNVISCDNSKRRGQNVNTYKESFTRPSVNLNNLEQFPLI